MSEVRITTDKTSALVNEHAARFSIMVNAGTPPAEAIASSLTSLAADVGFTDRHVALLLWGVVLDEMVGLEVTDEATP